MAAMRPDPFSIQEFKNQLFSVNFLLQLLLSVSLCCPGSSSSWVPHASPPPLPLPPLPSARQLQWQSTEMSLFLHFGINTFTDSEWGSGHADPKLFFPARLNASQWVEVAAASGFSRIILTAKHHDGFCLWPTQYTDYSVAASPWKGGAGDVVAELATATRVAGIGFGIYLSPWDRHERSYGDTVKYNEFYLGQMIELLTSYGEIEEVWLDGAKGTGEKDMEYFFDSWFGVIRQLQPTATIFSDAGPDSRWIGDEAGTAGSTCWSLFNRSAVTIGGPNDNQYCRSGDPNGIDWLPPECDVSIRPGWFWHSWERPKSALALLDIYYSSVGRNCLLLLNVPPNTSGLISGEDIETLQKFAELRRNIFSDNIAKNASLTASSVRGGTSDSRFSPLNVLQEGSQTYWAPDDGESTWEIVFNFRISQTFNVLLIQEPIQMGQRITEFHLDALVEGEWHTITNGTTVGHKRLLRFIKVECQSVRLVISKSRASPLVSYVGLYWDPSSARQCISDPWCNLPVIQMPASNHSFNTKKAV